MARRSRTVINFGKLDEMQQALATGVGAGLRDMMETASARVSDVPELGVGIKYAGGYIVYANGKAVVEGSVTGVKVQPPSGQRVSKGTGLYGFIGFGRPARFLETGTVNMAARPFLSPVVMALAGNLSEHMKRAVGPLLRRP